MIDTKEKILDVAEELFSQLGFSATSLRAITQQAEVNLASVNYHFGGKEALIAQVLSRKAEPLNRLRIARLAALQAKGKPSLEELLTAFIAPALQMVKSKSGERYIKLLARVAIEPIGDVAKNLPGQYTEVLDQFLPAIIEHVPTLPAEELYWRIHFMLGNLGYCMAGQDAMLLNSENRLCDPNDIDGMISRLVTFVAAGMRADVPKQYRKAS